MLYIIMKVCLIGESYVGKTTLCYDMLDVSTKITEATIGLDFYSVVHKDLKVCLWDTAGEERYHSLLPIYLRKAAIIVYVISAQNIEKENYEYWRRFIDKNSDPNHKIIIVITKCDLNKYFDRNDLIHLKNFFPEAIILYRYKNNISEKLLDTVYELNTKYLLSTPKENKTNIDLDVYFNLEDKKKNKCC